MSIKDTLNPWGALAEARAELKETKEDLSIMDSEYGGMRVLWEDALPTIKEQQVRIIKLTTATKDMELRQRIMQSQFERLEDMLRMAHFRDPKTGRIGPRGRRFT